MDLERDLSPAADDPEPAWGDEDVAVRGSLWLARARALAARVEPGEEAPTVATPVPVPDVPAAPVPVAPDVRAAPAVIAETWVWSREDEDAARGSLATTSAPESPEAFELTAQQTDRDDLAWLAALEPVPGTLEVIAPADDPIAAHPDREFPPAWFPAPAGIEPAASGPEEAEPCVEALSPSLARFEAGQPFGAEAGATLGPRQDDTGHEVHAWFASSRAFVDTLQAEAAAVRREPEPETPPPSPIETAADEWFPENEAISQARPSWPDLAAAHVTAASEDAPPDAAAATEVPAEDWRPASWATDAWRPTAAEVPPADAPLPEASDADAFDDAWTRLDAAAGPDDQTGAPMVVEQAREGAPAPVVAAVDAPPSLAAVSATPPAVAPPASLPAATRQPVTGQRRSRSVPQIAGAAAALLAGAAVVVTMLVPKPSPAPPSAVVPVAPAAAAAPKAAAVAAPRAVPVPAWRETTEWTAGRRRSVAYEVAADRPVRLWMRQVTPVLVVRCLGGTLDAFVVTQSASAIEPGRTDHTVRLAFDEGPEAMERWTDSADHDGLFAPDGRSLLARAAGARRLRFAFTPHNAPVAEATFSLAGVEALKAPLARHCK